MTAPAAPTSTPLSTFWQPRAGQWVLCGVSLPFSHMTKSGKAVGIFQAAEVVIDPATALPYLDKATGRPVMNPPRIVPVDKNGLNVNVDRTNYKDLKGFTVLVPGKGLCHIGLDAEGAAIDKYFADNRTAELPLVLGVQEARLEGPLLDLADMPPGRVVAEGWKPRP